MGRAAALCVLATLVPRAVGGDHRRFFIVLTTQRTGSTWLSEELDEHPCLLVGKELFLDVKPWKGDVSYTWSNVTMRAATSRLVVPDPTAVKNFTYVYHHFMKRCWGGSVHLACGFKWMLSQGVYESWQPWLADFCAEHDIALIFLTRANLLSAYASKIAKRLRDYENGYRGKVGTPVNASHLSADKSRDYGEASPSIAMSTGDSLLSGLRRYEEEYALFRSMRDDARRQGIDHMSLTYEMLRDGRVRGLNAIVNFTLGEAPRRHGRVCDRFDFAAASQGKQQRLHTAPMSDFISNWDAVAGTLVGSRFERFLGADGSRVPRSWDADMGAWTDWGAQWSPPGA